MSFSSKTQKSSAAKTHSKKPLLILLSFLVVLFVASISCAFVFLGKKSQEVPSLVTQGETARYLASKEFASLSQDKKNELMKELREKNNGRPVDRDASATLTEEEKKSLRENMGGYFRAEMKKRVDDYFALPKEQRDAYLDNIIKEMAAMRARNPNRGQGQQGNPPGGSQAQPNSNQQAGQGQNQQGGQQRTFSAARMREHIETTDPADRAKAAEFRKALQVRMQQQQQKK